MTDEELLRTHKLSAATGRCRECGFSRVMILSGRIVCGQAPKRSSGRPVGSAGLVPSEEGAGYGWIRLVVAPSLRNRLIDVARRKDTTLSAIVRRAIMAYLDETPTGWGEKEVRAVIQKVAAKWTRKPVELEGTLLVFGMTPSMVDDIITELYRQERRAGRGE